MALVCGGQDAPGIPADADRVILTDLYVKSLSVDPEIETMASRELLLVPGNWGSISYTLLPLPELSQILLSILVHRRMTTPLRGPEPSPSLPAPLK